MHIYYTPPNVTIPMYVSFTTRKLPFLCLHYIPPECYHSNVCITHHPNVTIPIYVLHNTRILPFLCMYHTPLECHHSYVCITHTRMLPLTCMYHTPLECYHSYAYQFAYILDCNTCMGECVCIYKYIIYIYLSLLAK